MPDAWGRRLWSRKLRSMGPGWPGGTHKSPRVGPGTDLAGIRPFEPGDNPRKLDARASARRGFPHVRDDRHTPGQTLHWVIEGRARLASGPSTAPWEAIRDMVEMVTGVALACGDPVAMTLVEHGDIRHWPPSRNKALASECPARLATTLEFTAETGPDWHGLVARESLALVITDGLSPTMTGTLAMVALRAETRLLLVPNPWLDSPVPPGPLVDPETNRMVAPLSREGWRDWLKGARGRMEAHRKACPRHAEWVPGAQNNPGSLLGALLGDQP